MGIALRHEVFQTHVWSLRVPLPGPLLEAAPADRQWSIDGEEQEERPAHKDVENRLSGNVGYDEAAPPASGDKVEKLFGRGEGVLRSSPEGQRGLRRRAGAILGGERGRGQSAFECLGD